MQNRGLKKPGNDEENQGIQRASKENLRKYTGLRGLKHIPVEKYVGPLIKIILITSDMIKNLLFGERGACREPTGSESLGFRINP